MKPTKTYLRFFCDVAQDVQTLLLSLKKLELEPTQDMGLEELRSARYKCCKIVEQSLANLNSMADIIADRVSWTEDDTERQRQETIMAIWVFRSEAVWQVLPPNFAPSIESIDKHKDRLIERFHIKRLAHDDEVGTDTVPQADTDIKPPDNDNKP